MKLLNYTSAYFAGILLLIISIWAGLFYFSMLDEIYDSMDDGLENQKILVIRKASADTTILNQPEFEAGYFTIKEIPFPKAQTYTDTYQDTLMYMENEEDYEPVRLLRTAFHHPNGRYYELQLITSMVEEDDLIADLLYSLVWLYLGLVASILLLNNFLLRKIWKPFYRLLERLQKFRLEDQQPLKTTKTNIEEFKLLNETVQKLIKSNIAAFNSQKQFIENASHELQTPLAISLNKLELLVENNNLSEAQLEILASIINNLERSTRLNKSLSQLSRIENRQFPEVAATNFNDLIKKQLEDLTDLAEHREVTLHLEEQGNLQAQVNPDLANILITNLLKNAISHNISGGTVKVQVKPESLTVQNTGSGNALDPQQIFNRFYKGEQNSGSTGLGLAIVKAITDLYGFRIEYSFQDGKHRFTVYLT
ncbi:HAMP domain-containing histidine kinase [Adhaeribacter sp. BT258]|uniref:histidine kinase n=1 Tax=Adhaeribacter terrigena TaxID=2793070 RepID=A0ABS1C2R2_9BACT|nr:HAMP domain-containing sensor histidine kinase [Adhaeribacter terrigena]MBK0403635.1 HAMP domain-containing histidine kinase [Adhaeribacter terrigena]